MNKKALIITIIIVILALIGIFVYDRVYNQPEATLWNLVPDHSGLVYEPQAGMDSWDVLRKSELYKGIEEFPAIGRLDSFINQLDTIIGREQMNQILSDGKMLITMNPVSGSELDFLILYQLGSGRSTNHINALLKSYQEKYKLKTRTFNDFTIYELSEGKGKPFFTYSFSEMGWFGSFSPVLVEDVIRLLTTEKTNSYKNINPEPFFTTRIRNDAGNLFFSYEKVASLLKSFTNPKSRYEQNFVGNFGKNAFLDFNIQDPLLLFNGFSYWSENNQFLSKISGKKPRSSIIEQYIPSRTAFCINTLFGFERDSAASVSDKDLKDFLGSLDQEYAVVVLEAGTIEEAEKLYYLKSKNIDQSVDLLYQFAEKQMENKSDTLFYESYADYLIVEMSYKNFPQLFSEFTYGESDYYYFTSVNEYVVLSTSMESMKKFLSDIENENTWGKSVQKNNFLENTLEESNFGLYVDIGKSWQYILNELHPEWQEHMEEHSSIYRKFEFIALQFSNTDRKVFTNLIVSNNPDYVDVFAKRQRVAPDISVAFNVPVTTRPRVVRNHKTQAREVIVQNDSNYVSLIGSAGDVLWSKKLGGKVVSDIQQIDYFRNGYLQYLITYDSTVTLLDRNGNTVSGFPWKLPFKADKFNVIDYDNSKKYRFIFSDIKGNVFMYDKDGSMLEGWRPFFSNGRLAIEPRHIRVRGRDCIILFLQNGKFFLLNRRAEVMSGFPIDLGTNINFDYALSYGSGFENSVLTFVNKKGLVTAATLDGEILNQQQFLSELRNPEYYMVPDMLGRGFAVVAREVSNIQFMNEKGEVLFTKQILGGLNYKFQYYNFGSAKKLYVVTDPEQEYSYLYNYHGELLNNSPIDSRFEIGVLFSENNNQYKIYSAYEDKVNIYSF